jgi:hypothetical protein
LTDAGFIAVNGFVASPSPHNYDVAKAYYNNIRFMGKVPMMNSSVQRYFKGMDAYLGGLAVDVNNHRLRVVSISAISSKSSEVLTQLAAVLNEHHKHV